MSCSLTVAERLFRVSLLGKTAELSRALRQSPERHTGYVTIKRYQYCGCCCDGQATDPAELSPRLSREGVGGATMLQLPTLLQRNSLGNADVYSNTWDEERADRDERRSFCPCRKVKLSLRKLPHLRWIPEGKKGRGRGQRLIPYVLRVEFPCVLNAISPGGASSPFRTTVLLQESNKQTTTSHALAKHTH